MSDNALAARPVEPMSKSEAIDKLRERYDKLQKRDLDVVASMNRFAELPSFVEEAARKQLIDVLNVGTDEEIRTLYGFKGKRELRMALYGTLPKKDWPAAMQAAHERVLARQRKQNANQTRQVFNLNVVTIPAPRLPSDEDRIVIVQPEEPVR